MEARGTERDKLIQVNNGKCQFNGDSEVFMGFVEGEKTDRK